MVKEDEVIRAALAQFGAPRTSDMIGIGDDAAVIPFGSTQLVIATDALADRVHFDTCLHSYAEIGHKALAVNLSDIAAMAARPLAATVAVMLPRAVRSEDIEAMMAAMRSLGDRFSMSIVGGDTNIYDGPLVISVTVLGEVVEGRVALRSGAEPGDRIFVTGSLGGSIGGRHLNFLPRIDEATELAAKVRIKAMMDISDGLGDDLRKMARASDCRFVIDANAVPIHDDIKHSTPQKDWIRRAFSDGEDFELLFCVGRQDALALGGATSVALSEIGRVVEGEGVVLQRANGCIEPMHYRGYEHGKRQ